MPSISGAGGGAGGLSKLFDSGTLGASAASIDTGANGVAAGHADLLVFIYARTDRVAQQDSVSIILNNDSGANYDTTRLQGINVTASAASAAATTSLGAGGITIPAASDTAGQFAAVQVFIPSYGNTVGFKIATILGAFADETVAQSGMGVWSASWRNTAAITRIGITPVTGPNFVAGSRMVVYGCQ